MVPSHHHLRSVTHGNVSSSTALRNAASSPSSLLEHVDHLGLEDRVDRLDRHPRSTLRHRKDIYRVPISTEPHRDGSSNAPMTRTVNSSTCVRPISSVWASQGLVETHKLSQHEPHHLERYPSSSVLEHLQPTRGSALTPPIGGRASQVRYLSHL